MTDEIQPELGTSSEAASEWSVGRQAVGSTCSVFWVREAAVGLICLRTLFTLLEPEVGLFQARGLKRWFAC